MKESIKDQIKKAVMEVLQEKKLSKAEKNKKEDIVKAMAKQGASKDSKTYAIATAKAKKLAEGEGDTSMDDILDAFQAALTIKDDTQQEQALKTVYNALKNKVKSKAGDLYQKARVGFAKSQGIDPGELNEDSQAKIPYLPLSKKEVETLNSEGKITKTFAGTGFSHKVNPKTVNTYLNATEVTYTDWNTGQRVKAPVDVENSNQLGSISITVYSALKNKVKTEASNLYQKARVGFAKSQDIDSSKLNEVEEETDAVDTITMDVPLFIRMLEYAREDASADVDLHDVAENAVSLNKEQDILSMDDYDALLPSDAESIDKA